MERFFDVLFSGFALLVLSPFLIPIVVILKFSGEGEVFFSQKRMGKDGKLFKLFKFATMLKDSPNLGTGTVTMRDDPRVLPVGKFLRKTKINELPQIINIFIGDMSIIGPRPLTEQTFSSYSDTTQAIISQVRPGLSGVGSIIFRGEEDIMHGTTASVDFYDNSIAPFKGALEEWFVANKSLSIYFMAIFVTVWVVLFPKTKVPWIVFKGLPMPPKELKTALDFKDQ
jgi:lipopolysaccharide/colanic/teichoic acid biosynthesis glycosyltransferase